MAKIAVASDPVDSPPRARTLAVGAGWSVADVVCTLGPRARPFEEQHAGVSIAVVRSGTFQYRAHGREVMTPGSVLLGNPGQCFECGHEHGTGDRCVSFSYSPEFFAGLEADPVFRSSRLPPVRELSRVVARVCGTAAGAAGASWEELSIEIAAQTVALDRGTSPGDQNASPAMLARVTRVVRTIDREPEGACDLAALARQARLSPFHFLRVFRGVTGVTPHQYLLRLRLQRAAIQLQTGSAKIADIALDAGFGDISNFNRAFRSEFGVNPRAWRGGSRTSRDATYQRGSFAASR